MNSVDKVAAQGSVESAASQGAISISTAQSLISHLNSGDEQLDAIALSGCQGVDPGMIDSEEITLVSAILDASGSMEPHRDDVIISYNERFLKAIQGAKNARSILIELWIFSSGTHNDNCRLVHGFTPAPDCPELTKRTYSPQGSTPLWDAIQNAFTGIVTYGQILRDSGTRTKCIVVVLSDGENNDSKVKLPALKKVASDLLRQEIYVLSYVFFGDHAAGDRYATEVGFPKQHRLTDSLDNAGIRRVFGTLSSSIITASQAKISASSLSNNAFIVP